MFFTDRRHNKCSGKYICLQQTGLAPLFSLTCPQKVDCGKLTPQIKRPLRSMEKAQRALYVATLLFQFHLNEHLIILSKMRGPDGLIRNTLELIQIK